VVFTASTPPPTGVSATAVSSTQIDVSWQSVDGSSAYRVEHSTAQTTWSTVATTTATSLSDTGLQANTTYQYPMMSIIASAESGPSMTASATTLPDTIAPSAPQQLTATPGQRKVTLAWIASTDKGGSGLSGYEIWRSTTGSQGAFTRITTTSALSVVNSGLSKNTTYWYYVTAVDGAQNRSAASGIVSAKPQ